MSKEARSPEWVRKTPSYVAVADQVEKAQTASRAVQPVTDEATCAAAAELLSKVAKVVKYGDKLRLDTSLPYRQSTDAINAEFKEVISPVVGVEKRLREEVENYEAKVELEAEEAKLKHEKEVREAEQKQREAEEEAKRKAEEAEKAGEPEPEPEPAPPPPPPPPPPPAPPTGTRKTSTGSVGRRETWHYEVMDFAEVPDDLKSLNQAEATRRVRAGERSIPGLRIYSKKGTNVR